MNPVGEGLGQDHDWEEDSFGDEDHWTVGSLQAVPQSPPGLHPRGGCTTTGAVAPRGDGKGSGASDPGGIIANIEGFRREDVQKYFDEVTHVELPAKLVKEARTE